MPLNTYNLAKKYKLVKESNISRTLKDDIERSKIKVNDLESFKKKYNLKIAKKFIDINTGKPIYIGIQNTVFGNAHVYVVHDNELDLVELKGPAQTRTELAMDIGLQSVIGMTVDEYNQYIKELNKGTDWSISNLQENKESAYIDLINLSGRCKKYQPYFTDFLIQKAEKEGYKDSIAHASVDDMYIALYR